MGNPWDVRAAEWAGKAIPNEASKLNSYSKYLQYIPYVGQALSAIMKGMSAVDTGATRYADIYKDDDNRAQSSAVRRGNAAMPAIQGVMGGIQGQSQDPGTYGSPDRNRDWANIAGAIGNILPSGGGGMGSSSGGSVGGGGFQGNVTFGNQGTDGINYAQLMNFANMLQ